MNIIENMRSWGKDVSQLQDVSKAEVGIFMLQKRQFLLQDSL